MLNNVRSVCSTKQHSESLPCAGYGSLSLLGGASQNCRRLQSTTCPSRIQLGAKANKCCPEMRG